MATLLDVGLLSFLMPLFVFLFIFAIIYALLTKTKMLGDNMAAMNFLAAVCISAVAVFAGTITQVVVNVTPWIVFIIIVLSGIFKRLISFAILILFFCINIFYVFQENRNWNKASVISENIVNEINKIDSCENLIIINLPDNLNGAYMFRDNTFERVIKFKKYYKKFAVSELIITHDIKDENDSVDVKFNINNGPIDVSGLTLPFYILENNSSIYKIDKIIGNRISIIIKNKNQKTTILYYSKGHLVYL